MKQKKDLCVLFVCCPAITSGGEIIRVLEQMDAIRRNTALRSEPFHKMITKSKGIYKIRIKVGVTELVNVVLIETN
jgi:hypothetical protein